MLSNKETVDYKKRHPLGDQMTEDQYAVLKKMEASIQISLEVKK